MKEISLLLGRRDSSSGTDFDLTEAIYEATRLKFHIGYLLINDAHPHSAQDFPARGYDDPTVQKWREGENDKLMDALSEAAGSPETVSLKAGRAPVRIGFNRRMPDETGFVLMNPNRDGPMGQRYSV